MKKGRILTVAKLGKLILNELEEQAFLFIGCPV